MAASKKKTKKNKSVSKKPTASAKMKKSGAVVKAKTKAKVKAGGTKTKPKTAKAVKVKTAPKATSFSTKKWDSIFTPLDDRVVVRLNGPSERTPGGIFIPGSVSDRPNEGTILCVGRGHRNKRGRLRPMDVQVGDTVIFAQYAGSKMTVNNEEVLILRESDLLGIL